MEKTLCNIYKFIEQSNRDLVREIFLCFGGLGSLSFGASTIIQNPLSLESLKEIFEGTIVAILDHMRLNLLGQRMQTKELQESF